MSMSVVLVKVSPSLYHTLVATKGALLNDLLSGSSAIDGFDRAADVLQGIDYRVIAEQAEDEEDAPTSCSKASHSFKGMNGLTGLPRTLTPPQPAISMHYLR